MTFSSSKSRRRAVTLVETIIVIAICVVLFLTILPRLAGSHKAPRMTCVNNLRQMGLGAIMWEQDHNNQFPQMVSTNNGGARELIQAGNVAALFQVMPYDQNLGRFLVCPVDFDRHPSTNLCDLSDSNISYFASLNSTNATPQSPLFGDDNFEVAGRPVKSGVQNLWTNQFVRWSFDRHRLKGIIARADGSAGVIYNTNLAQLIATPGMATNAVVIP